MVGQRVIGQRVVGVLSRRGSGEGVTYGVAIVGGGVIVVV